MSATDRPLIACLLPVRNGAAHLDDWLTSVERFADVVVALDDGSTDDTRAWLETSPLVAHVLGNPVRPTYRGWDDAANRTHRSPMWVGRLFAYRPELRLPSERLHLLPIPTSIPRRRWRRTTLRIQHLADLTEEHRRAHVEKYREVDPDGVFQAGYSNLLKPPARVREWTPRPPQVPVLVDSPPASA